MNHFLFKLSDFVSRPPGFYLVLAAMVLCTALVPLGLTDVVTYALSVLAIVITGVVLIQGFRDTAAIHAKLDEIIVALNDARNESSAWNMASLPKSRPSGTPSSKKRRSVATARSAASRTDIPPL